MLVPLEWELQLEVATWVLGIVCWLPFMLDLLISLHLMPNNDISIPIAQWSHKHYSTITEHMMKSVMILSYTNCDASYIKPYDTLLSLIMINHVAAVLWFTMPYIFNLDNILSKKLHAVLATTICSSGLPHLMISSFLLFFMQSPSVLITEELQAIGCIMYYNWTAWPKYIAAYTTWIFKKYLTMFM